MKIKEDHLIDDSPYIAKFGKQQDARRKEATGSGSNNFQLMYGRIRLSAIVCHEIDSSSIGGDYDGAGPYAWQILLPNPATHADKSSRKPRHS
jgi:hypothetical protein